MDTTFIYALTEPGTRTIRYFGKANNPKKRRVAHIRDAKLGKKYPVLFWIRKLLKTGRSPDVHVLCEVPDNDWERFECAFIALGRHCDFKLKNATDGGDGLKNPAPATLKKMREVQLGKTHSAETRAKMSAAHRAPTHEMRAKMSAAQKGRKHTPETLLKMSAAQAGEKNPRFGKTPSSETRAKMSAAHKSSPNSGEFKPGHRTWNAPTYKN